MLKIFRKYRQNLIDQGKAKRYLVYALGEIILVVIGILIALSINNWNTLQNEKKELKGYLNNISNNIKSDRSNIKSLIMIRDSTKFYAQRSLDLGNKQHITAEEFLSFINQDYNIFYDTYLEINQSGFEALKYSGYLGKIQNTRIEQLLNAYYQLVSKIAKQEKSFNDFIENMEVFGAQDNLFKKLLDVHSKPNINEYVNEHQNEIKALINHPSFLSANFRGSIVTELFIYYQQLLTIGDDIIAEIQNRLE